MRKARPSTQAIVRIENDNCLATLTRIPRYIRTDTRSTSAVAMVANAQAVPEADSQLKLKTALYAAAAATIGGIRSIWLCSPGHAIGRLTAFKTAAERG